MHVLRSLRIAALGVALLLVPALGAQPAHAASYTVSFTPNGFSSATGSANTGETVTVRNVTSVAVTFHFSACAEVGTVPAGGSFAFRMCVDTGTITAQASISVHVII